MLVNGFSILDIARPDNPVGRGCSILEIFPAYSNKDSISTIAIVANCEDKDGIQIFLMTLQDLTSVFRLPTPVLRLRSSVFGLSQTILRPKGVKASDAILKCWLAQGIPIIVIPRSIPKRT